MHYCLSVLNVWEESLNLIDNEDIKSQDSTHLLRNKILNLLEITV